jgi:NAD-dependent DNA ligase
VATALRVGRPGTGFVFSAFRVERGVELLSEIECLSWLCEQGFSCPETRFVAVDEIEQAWRDRAAGRFPLLGAPTDGIVVKISCWKQQRELGGSSRIPYWAIAVKSDADLLG